MPDPFPHGIQLKWRGGEVTREIEAGVRQNITAASIYLASVIKADISQPGTLRYAGRTKKGTPTKRTKTVYNFTHSAPGNPPYKQTGRLRASITREVHGLVGRVGTNVIYSRFLEKGTRKMAPRPFLLPNLRKHHATLVRILTGRIRQTGLPAIVSNQYRSGILGAGARSLGY